MEIVNLENGKFGTVSIGDLAALLPGGPGVDPAILSEIQERISALEAGGTSGVRAEFGDVVVPWSQAYGRVPIDYLDSKVVSQAFRVMFPGGLGIVILMHSLVIQPNCLIAIPEPGVGMGVGEEAEWEFKLPYPTLFRGYWTAEGEIYNGAHTYYDDGAIHLRTELNDVAFAALRFPRPELHKKGTCNKRSPFYVRNEQGAVVPEAWVSGGYYKFTAVYPTYE